MSACPDAFAVPKLEPMKVFLYLAPLAPRLEEVTVDHVPDSPPGCVRVVCISDTHNEHETLILPKGDVLIHTGDVLTESGFRHVVRDPGTREVVRVKPHGEELFVKFARWFGSQQFDNKVLVAGNHDLVLQGLGSSRVQAILDENATHGRAFYLENCEAKVGRLRVFGSPYANYSSHNDAFKSARPAYDIRPGVHIVATHMPAVLPSKKSGKVRYHEEITQPMLDAGSLLHVGGHCHWANGLYFAQGGSHSGRIPCVVASVCESHWLTGRHLASADGFRGDPSDKKYGGYNLVQPGMICDLVVPEPPAATPTLAPSSSENGLGVSEFFGGFSHTGSAHPSGAGSRPRSSPPDRRKKRSGRGAESESLVKPSLLFFCPSNDAELVPLLLPQLQTHFVVDHVETVSEAHEHIAKTEYRVCVSKLGTKHNLAKDFLATLRSSQGSDTFIAIHSATVARNPGTQAKLTSELGIDHFTQHGCEEELLQMLELVARDGGRTLRLLVFAPPNDPDFIEALVPHLPSFIKTDVFEYASECVQALRDVEFSACFCKLGKEGNLGVDVIAAFRGEFGVSPFVAVHSATVFRKSALRARLAEELGVNLFVKPGEEAAMVAAMLQVLERGSRADLEAD